MTDGQTDDPRPWQREIAVATVNLSNAVLAFGEAIAGTQAIAEALNGEVAAAADADDLAGYGVDEDDRRPPEDGEAWACPRGLPDVACAALHDHYPTPRRRRHGEG